MTTGLSLRVPVKSFQDMKLFVDGCVQAGIVRCLSPGRRELCDHPATHICWQDQAEWYPCCEEHRLHLEQWCGHTRFSPHLLDLPVIPHAARAWLAGLSAAERSQITLEAYEREAQ